MKINQIENEKSLSFSTLLTLNNRLLIKKMITFKYDIAYMIILGINVHLIIDNIKVYINISTFTKVKKMFFDLSAHSKM